jgi:hypothetical protein
LNRHTDKLAQNDQIDIALNSFLDSKAIREPSERLSKEGQTLVADFSEVVKQAKYLLLSKNEGNLLQDFIWQTQQFDVKAVNVPDAPVDKESAKRHGDVATEGLRTLGTLIITNGQFRKLCECQNRRACTRGRGVVRGGWRHEGEDGTILIY